MRKRLVVQTNERLTIADLISHYLQHARQRDRRPLGTGTYTLQLGYLENHIGPSEFGQKLPEQLEDGDLRRFTEEVRSGLAPASAIGVLKLVRAAFRWAGPKGRVPESAAAPVASLISELKEESTSASSKIPFERDEVEELLRKAREFRPWLYPMLRLAFSTGLRRGEVLGLQWDDIDWPRGRIHLARQINWLTLKPEKLKGRKRPEHKLIDVPPGAMAMLANLQAEARPGVPWVFATGAGTHYLPNNVARGYRQLLAELQDEQKQLKQTPIRQLPFHAARHTFASQAFAEMMDPSWVSRQLGHHSVAFTLDTYVHLLPGRRDFAAVEFGDSSHRLDTPGHKPDTRAQNEAERDADALH
jgi:integrase